MKKIVVTCSAIDRIETYKQSAVTFFICIFFFFQYLEEEENKVEALCKLQSKTGFILPPFPVRFFFYLFIRSILSSVILYIPFEYKYRHRRQENSPQKKKNK